MRVILATNEPWGTYHAAPLVMPAVAAGIELVQWVPDLERVPVNTQVEVTDDRSALDDADLVVVNGLFSEHTEEAAAAAVAADIPLCLSELAYLRAQPSPRRFPFAAVQANSPASAAVVGIHSETRPDHVTVVGWPGLDSLPPRLEQPGLVVGLTGVSQQTATGGHHAGDEHEILYGALLSLEEAGYEIAVRRHPRETDGRWTRWPLREGATTAEALSDAAIVVGLAGTPAFYTAAYGIPFLGIAGAGLPDYLASCVTPLDTAEAAVELAAVARPLGLRCLMRALMAGLGQAELAKTAAVTVAQPEDRAADQPLGRTAELGKLPLELRQARSLLTGIVDLSFDDAALAVGRAATMGQRQQVTEPFSGFSFATADAEAVARRR